MHTLVGICLKQKSIDPPTMTSSLTKDDSGSNKGAEYEVISNDTSQDSMDNQNVSYGDLVVDIFQKDTCPIKTRIFDTINRHMILKLHLSLTKEVLSKKTDGNTSHLIREVQRII